MRPTPGEQLQAIAALLDAVAADPSLAAASATALDDARRLVRGLARSWDEVVPFLVTDNARLGDLLASLRPTEPAEPAGPAGPTDGLTAPVRFAEADARNVALRAELARAIETLAPDAPGDAARARIAVALRQRREADPTFRSSR